MTAHYYAIRRRRWSRQ